MKNAFEIEFNALNIQIDISITGLFYMSITVLQATLLIIDNDISKNSNLWIIVCFNFRALTKATYGNNTIQDQLSISFIYTVSGLKKHTHIFP